MDRVQTPAGIQATLGPEPTADSWTRIPAANLRPPQNRGPAPESGKGTMTKILLVEDNEMNRDMLSRRLVKRGFEIETAVDGAEGVKKARTVAPDLILMDMSLPVMHGWDATREIKGDAAIRDIPVIALTAHAMTGDREKALEAGCDEFETKPVELPRLLEKINKLLSE